MERNDVSHSESIINVAWPYEFVSSLSEMSEYMDQVFVMGYDSQDSILVGELNRFDSIWIFTIIHDISQSFVWNDLIQTLASSTDPLNVIEQGLLSYINMGIPPSKLILGVPWYSYVYPCLFIPENQHPIPPCFVNFPG